MKQFHAQTHMTTNEGPEIKEMAVREMKKKILHMVAEDDNCWTLLSFRNPGQNILLMEMNLAIEAPKKIQQLTIGTDIERRLNTLVAVGIINEPLANYILGIEEDSNEPRTNN